MTSILRLSLKSASVLGRRRLGTPAVGGYYGPRFSDDIFWRQQRFSSDQKNDTFEIPIEERYSRKTPLEHVLLRPGMYVGPNERLPPVPTWVMERSPPPPSKDLLQNPTLAERRPLSLEHPIQMIQKDLSLVPALAKVFDEILVNASDNRLRHPDSCTRIDVVIDPGSDDRDPFIRIRNDGKGIPVQIHEKEQMYLPELLFGNLLTGSNFNDDEKRLTGGRHGFGAKLSNIFSKVFTVETVDSSLGLKYRQSWTNNMSVCQPPEITETDESDYTCISFVPDIARLTGDTNSYCIAEEDYSVMCRRVADIAGCVDGKLSVTLNGFDLSRNSFEDYCHLYRSSDSPPILFARISPRISVAVGLSESGSFESVSFVNGMATPRGGTHVNAIVQQISKMIQERLEKTDAELSHHISQGSIRRNLFVAVDALIENPSFDSQMKEYLTSSPAAFGTEYSVSDKFMKELMKDQEKGGPGIIEELVRMARGKQQATLMKEVGGKKTRRQLLSIPKLEDAHKAGSQDGWDCTLILTEGDSAKALAIAGLEVIGRDRYGVFPLRGKFLNVREASVIQLTKNAEVKALCSILGLDFEKDYSSSSERRELRYGRIMLMTDQDTDGSHIKGLVINFFRHFWPKLLQPPLDLSEQDRKDYLPFLSSFVTPLLKATNKRSKKNKISFYSIAEYKRWRESLGDELKEWSVKYYKGLGTSTPDEAREYFSAFDNHFRPFHWNSEVDGELLDMVFDKKRAADRRDWILNEFDEEKTIFDGSLQDGRISYQDFVNREMIHFSHADNIRSIPSAIDGLKPSQRKVLYACFKRKLTSEIKVAQLSGYCAEHTSYHHGEVSLQSTIIGMAQDFVGSNNINLLVPSGQFGTRLTGGKDAASPRYIFTQLSTVARLIYPEVDDQLLTYKEDDGQMIEPEYYCGVVPMLAIQGSQGIGTGWSTTIPPHNPFDVIDYIQAKLDGAPLPKVRPYAKAFSGRLEENKEGNGYVSYGNVKVTGSRSILIDELPLRCWTNDYKEHLLKLRDRGEIQDIKEDHTTTSVSFSVTVKGPKLIRLQNSDIYKSLKLTTSLPMTNMHAFDENGVMQKFDRPEDIIEAYFPVRMAMYDSRKRILEAKAAYAAALNRSKASFIEHVVSGRVNLISGKETKAQTAQNLRKLGLSGFSELQGILGIEDSLSMIEPSQEYDYLLNMPLRSLTVENIDDLTSTAERASSDLKQIKDTSGVDLWRLDLEKLSRVL